MMKIKKVNVGAFAMLVALGCFMVLPAFAACKPLDKMRFSPVRNDTAQTTMLCDAKGISRPYKAGKNYQFTSVDILAQPTNGVLSVFNFGIKYKPKPGFKGNDAFATRVCATRLSESGCSRLNYNIQVQ